MNLIVIPTYNEKTNIEKLIAEVDKITDNKFDILFIDDNSPDGTGGLIERIHSSRPDISLFHRPHKMGLGSAYLAGFQYAVEKGYDYIIEMDADLSHSPQYLNPMFSELRNADVVIGSRFLGKLRNINKTPLRILISIIASNYMRLILGLSCFDPMSGFVGYKGKVLKSLDFSKFISKGYAFQSEIKYRSRLAGFKIAEIPIIFKNRAFGDSKISKNDVLEALLVPWKLRLLIG